MTGKTFFIYMELLFWILIYIFFIKDFISLVHRNPAVLLTHAVEHKLSEAVNAFKRAN